MAATPPSPSQWPRGFIALPQGESRSQRLATFYSQACTRYALNCIYAEAFAVNYQENVGHWDEIIAQMEREGE